MKIIKIKEFTSSIVNIKISFFVLMIFFISCTKNNSENTLSKTDSLLQSNPELALHIIDSINEDTKFSHEAEMHIVWNKVKCLQLLGESLASEDKLPEAVEYYTKNGDNKKKLDGYLLMATYLSWTNDMEKAIIYLEKGYEASESLKDTMMMINFLNAESGIYTHKKDYKKSVEKIKELLKYSEKLDFRQRSYFMYNLGLNLSLSGDKNYEEYYKKSIDIALLSGDTAIACEYMRNYSGSLSGDHKYIESNDLLHKIKKLNPEVGKLSAIQMNMAENYLNLHNFDSARICYNNAYSSEQTLNSEGYSDIARKGSMEIINDLIDYQSGKNISIAPFARYCDSITNDIIMRNKTKIKELEEKQQLQTVNNNLHMERNRLWLYLLILIIIILLGGTASYFYISNKYTKMAEIEERAEILKRLVEETKISTDETLNTVDNTFFKKVLMNQLGIIKLMASIPTNQNQEMLKRIAAISEGKISVNELISWTEIYPIIDSLYNNFYSVLIEKYGTTLTNKEINICCLLCANFSTKEIGIITQQSDATIYVRKTSIRKKIGADEKQDIVDFINEFRSI